LYQILRPQVGEIPPEKNVASRKVFFAATSHFLELLDKALVSSLYLGK
jgi:hypothetical protein